MKKKAANKAEVFSTEEEDFSDDSSNEDFDEEEPSKVKEEEEEEEEKVKGVKHLLALKDSLGLDQFKEKSLLKKEKRKRQKERRRLKKAEEQKAKCSNVEVVVYKDPRKRKRTEKRMEMMAEEEKKADHEVTMKQARFDVFKFGLRGLDREGQQDARVALALRLGAKPEKNKCVNYVEYKEKVKADKEEKARQKEASRVGGMMKVAARPASKKAKAEGQQKSDGGGKANKKKASGGHENIALKMGKFDGGILRLSKKDIAKMKRS